MAIILIHDAISRIAIEALGVSGLENLLSLFPAIQLIANSRDK
jgi:hypothetical protein